MRQFADMFMNDAEFFTYVIGFVGGIAALGLACYFDLRANR